ncbi:MAG: hypothetical protein B6D46_02910 [Polyangiaceae bacterium UTPRO1]|jgi:HEAT repeat protein|nr:HEAT repeat domain-containing protein [Myxococcales bacterium]OQY68611.1 MAG: hypothetical protein B6D46_02910 [Polyangiaceae bacterium UTPRO1]
MTPHGRRLALATAVFAYALAYLLPFRAYGLNVEDEGTLLYQIARVVGGELPYVDFSTGYTPGFFALSAALWRAVGDLVGFRTLVALVHAATAAGLAGLLAGVARPWIALALPALYLAYIPVYPGEFCAFNIAYPAWFATAGWTATAAATVAFARRGRRAWLAVAGAAAAATLAMKPNAGVFAFAAAAASVLACERSADGRGGRVVAALWGLVFVGILFGVVVVFGIVPRPLDAVVYLVPLALVMAGTATRGCVRRAGAFGDLLVLGAPFLMLSLPWLAFFWRRLGTAGFLREVLLIGSGAADIYYEPFPRPEPWGLLLTALAIGYASAAFLARRWVLPRATVAAIVLAAAPAAGAVARFGVMPEGLLWSAIWQLQSGAFTLALVAHAAGACWLWRRRRRGSAIDDAAPVVLLVFASFMFLQLYPRADFMHLLAAAPLSLVFAGFLLERVLRAWEHALASRHRRVLRALVIGTAALPAAAIGVGLLPGLQILRSGGRFVLPFAAAPVGVEEERADDLRALAAASERVGSRLRTNDATLGFPSLAVVLFLTGGRNPTPHDYFFPGRPDHREEAEIVDALAAAGPTVLAALNHQFTFFDAAPAYYFLLRGFVRAHYALGERDGRFDVLVSGSDAVRLRRGAAAAPPLPVSLGAALAGAASEGDLGARLQAIAALAAHPAAATAPALLALAGDGDALVRRAAVTALLAALEREPERGLETYVAASGLDRRARILLLRTIRDLRDPRAASYLFAEAASGDLRIIRDALGAMKVTRAELVARAHLWAGPELPAVWPGREALAAAVRAVLVDAVAPPAAAAFAAELAGRLGDAATVDSLRVRLRAGTPGAAAGAVLADAATTASAAAALAVLAPRGVACELTALLARPEAALAELVPTTLLDLAATDAAARAEVVECVRGAVAGGVEPALWIAAALGEPSLVGAVRAALGHGSAAVRRAAAWSLGELPATADVAPALAEAASSDGDDIVRRLAGRAYSKQSGALPRSLVAIDSTAFSMPGSAGYNTSPPASLAAPEGPA